MAISALSAAPGDAIARNVPPEPDVRITVRVDDKAGVLGTHLKLAEARAAKVFALSGVTVEWIDGREAARLNLTVTYTILIMAEAPAALKAAMEAIGADVMGQGAPFIGRAYIYYDRVLKLSPIPPRDIVSTLGDVMAHELGHLMLPPGHSSVGIMRPSINMTSRRVETFTEAEIAEIHAQLQRAQR
jgi:hypothetical protein